MQQSGEASGDHIAATASAVFVLSVEVSRVGPMHARARTPTSPSVRFTSSELADPEPSRGFSIV